MTLDPKRTVAELKELRSLTGDANGAQRVAWTDTWLKAREWFEKAAAQNSRRARINLGYLYEQGLGVDRDIAKALNLYGEASGVSNDKLVFASSVTAEVNQAKAESASLTRASRGSSCRLIVR